MWTPPVEIVLHLVRRRRQRLVSWYRQEVNTQSPEFRRTFPKIVLAVCGIGLLLVFIAAFMTAIGYEP